ncbi:MAG: MBOAT family protein [Bdellovibrionaceae bacterium]|nr:MBOAT family protein [Pseudobdellovibrionaceae bacterium]
MLFPTLEFAIFFAIVFYFSWELIYNNSYRKLFLLLASYFFYATLDFRFLPILILSPTLNFLFGLWIGVEDDPKVKKGILIFTVAANLALLGIFKYYDFFAGTMIEILSHAGYGPSWGDDIFMNFVLPLGISFFTFQGISYLVDIYRKEMTYKNSLLDVLLYISFFPHLVAGPIVKASEFIPQLKQSPKTDEIPFLFSMVLIILGLFKKTIIANYLGSDVVDPVFENPNHFGAVDIVFAVYCYAVQIFCDFSAYSDMAIGLAYLLGYRFPLNFNQPYRAASLKDFWNRWHISLSRWLREYLYIPLGGNRVSEKRTYQNLLITMGLGGLWHGASWNFITWGLLHGMGLAFEKRFQWDKPKETWFKNALQITIVFHFVCFAWIFFRAETFTKSYEMLIQFVDFSKPIHKLTPFYLTLFVLGMSFHFMRPLRSWNISDRWLQLPAYAYAIVFALMVTIVTALMPEGIAPFIYFRF